MAKNSAFGAATSAGLFRERTRLEHSMSLLEEATTIVVARQQQYDLIVADFYFMAVLSGDREEAQRIWEDVWERGTNELVALLLWAETQAELVRTGEGQ